MMKNKVVYGKWVDSYTVDSWREAKDAKKETKPFLICKTVGWLIDADEDHITISHTFNYHSSMGILHIPRGCIKKIKYLEL